MINNVLAMIRAGDAESALFAQRVQMQNEIDARDATIGSLRSDPNINSMLQWNHYEHKSVDLNLNFLKAMQISKRSQVLVKLTAN